MVENRWPEVTTALCDFEPGGVAALATTIEELLDTPGMIRNRSKVEAVIGNAVAMQGLAAAHGSALAFVRTLRGRPWSERLGALRAVFRRMGENTAAGWLRDLGEPVPDEAPRARAYAPGVASG